MKQSIKYFFLAYTFVVIAVCGLPLHAESKKGNHAIAMHGSPKYQSGFEHFDYVNPQAPKQGKIVLDGVGSFDTLNPYTIKGVPESRIHLVYDTLMAQAEDEPFSQYGLIAESIELTESGDSVIFHLNPKARFHDGKPVTADDVVFTFNALIEKGSPFYRAYYSDVTDVKAIDPATVQFFFRNNTNKELPLILGQLTVLPRHFWKHNDFSKNILDPVLGSGPYKITDIDPGRSITYQLVEDYWAKDLPVNKGKYNFKTIRIDYYRDQNVALEGFKSGQYDFQLENSSKRWATSYKGKNFKNGSIIKEEIRHYNPTGMQAFVMNTRRAIFRDPRIREALDLAFDFEWTNENLFYSAYTRTNSFFSNSELAATGLPGKEELKILAPFKGQIPDGVFTQEYKSPLTDGSGNNRKNLRKAKNLLKQSGWIYKDKKLVNSKTLKPFTFEILLRSKDFERVVLPYIRNLEKLGVTVDVRLVDMAQYIKMVKDFDFDMIIYSFGQSSSPGNEQRDYWFSGFADTKGSRNVAGIKDPVIDKLVEQIINAKSRKELVSATRSLDRVLLWGHYVIPQWHINSYRVAYKNKFSRPQTPPKYGLGFYTWWVDESDETTSAKSSPADGSNK